MCDVHLRVMSPGPASRLLEEAYEALVLTHRVATRIESWLSPVKCTRICVELKILTKGNEIQINTYYNQLYYSFNDVEKEKVLFDVNLH